MKGAHVRRVSVTDMARRLRQRVIRWTMEHGSVPVCGVPHPDYCDPVYCTRGPAHDGVHMMIVNGRTIIWRTKESVND